MRSFKEQEGKVRGRGTRRGYETVKYIVLFVTAISDIKTLSHFCCNNHTVLLHAWIHPVKVYSLALSSLARIEVLDQTEKLRTKRS